MSTHSTARLATALAVVVVALVSATGVEAGVATPTAPPATPSPTATPICGDGVIVSPGETCDPAGFPAPNGALCRADCTYCGDGITQLVDGESCDDGNTVSGCRPDKPQKPLDGCLNSCQRPICDDPARIQLWDEASTGKRDVVQVHARLVSDVSFDFASQPFELAIARRLCSDNPTRACSVDADCSAVGAVCTDRACAHDAGIACGDDATCEALSAGSTCSLTSAQSEVFRQVLSGIPLDRPLQWRHRNANAKTQGGIADLKIKSKTDPRRCAGGADDGRTCTPSGVPCVDGACVGYYLLTLKAYGDAERAVQDMQTTIIVGGQRWALRGLWSPSRHAWKLDKRSPQLEPWP